MKAKITKRPLTNPKIGDAVIDRYGSLGMIIDVKGRTLKVRHKHSTTKTVGDKTLRDACEEYFQLWAEVHTGKEFLVSNIEDVAYLMINQPEPVNGILSSDYLYEERSVFRVKETA